MPEHVFVICLSLKKPFIIYVSFLASVIKWHFLFGQVADLCSWVFYNNHVKVFLIS